MACGDRPHHVSCVRCSITARRVRRLGRIRCQPRRADPDRLGHRQRSHPSAGSNARRHDRWRTGAVVRGHVRNSGRLLIAARPAGDRTHRAAGAAPGVHRTPRRQTRRTTADRRTPRPRSARALRAHPRLHHDELRPTTGAGTGGRGRHAADRRQRGSRGRSAAVPP